MNKTLTLNIPDELWVDQFTENLTKEFQYSGPAVIWTKEREQQFSYQYFLEEPENVELNERVIKIDIATATEAELAAAIILVNDPQEHVYEYADEVNHDGSIYKKITNPKLSDYYYPKLVTGQLTLVPVVKDPTNSNEAIAEQRKNYVLKYTKNFEFGEQEQQLIDGFMSSIDAYLEVMKTAYPWKYISMNVNEVPKIPVALVSIFNTLPVIN